MLETGLLAGQATQEVQLRAADVGVTFHHHFVYARGAGQEIGSAHD